jgi:sec-independent protein translocase protein TatA
MNLGWMEITLLLVVVVILFGARRLPELGKGLGSGIRNFKSAIRDNDRQEIGDGRAADPAPETRESSNVVR